MIAAIVVTRNPRSDIGPLLTRAAAQVSKVLIVDNGSREEHLLADIVKYVDESQSLELHRNATNQGVASALNQGFRWAIERGFEYVLTLDQDSLPSTDMVAELSEAFAVHDAAKLGIAAPQLLDKNVGKSAKYLRSRAGFLFERVDCTGGYLRNVLSVISSGSLFSLRAYQEVGPFREDFFIDYVDTEYCLRLHQRGYEIIVVCQASLEHELGARREMSILGRAIFPTFHSPSRWYYFSRNRLPMIKTFGLREPGWLSYELVASAYGLVRMVVFEDRRLLKLREVMRGTWHGLIGQMGPRS